MDRAQEEAIQRITAQYVTALQSGRTPKLSAYLTRYPHYANEIADFVAYYHTFEEDIPPETEETAELSLEVRIAINSTLAHITQKPRRVKPSEKQELTAYQQRVAEEQATYQLSEFPSLLNDV